MTADIVHVEDLDEYKALQEHLRMARLVCGLLAKAMDRNRVPGSALTPRRVHGLAVLATDLLDDLALLDHDRTWQ